MKSADGRFEYLDVGGEPVPDGTPAEAVHMFGYQCRSNPSAQCVLNLKDRGHDIHTRNWVWDGNVDCPTLSPSINCRDGKCWHGFIQNGVFLKTDKLPEERQ